MDSALIRLTEQTRDEDGSFVVRVFYEDGSQYDVTVTDPASESDEALFAWYFEQHLRFPFLDLDQRQAAVERLRCYGEALFNQVFGDKAGRRYRDIRERGFDGCRIEITGTAGLHRLHWEALRDPEIDKPLVVRIPLVRKVALRPVRFELPDPRPTLNILVVTARPDGPADVGYRTISRPLLDAVRQASLPVTVDLVRPGTWAALRDHLRETTAREGTGWYHLVHFDLHGAFTDYGTIDAGARTGRYLFAGDPQPFDGKQGFLFFETAKVKQADPRSATEVASLLAEHRVPMAVLNACQSAMQTTSEAALAHQLVDAGVPVVLGMAYSVTVTAAALAMPELYQRLTQHSDADRAMLDTRRRLFDDPNRDGYFDQQLPLQDWLLPVVFQQRSIALSVRDMTEPEADRFYSQQAKVGDEPSTEYGFVGRDLDIQAIERMVLSDGSPNHVLVRGMAGAGKSTLLAHLGWWWQRTGLIDQVFTFSYDQRAWTVDQIVREIAKRLWHGVEFARWEALSEDSKRERVAGQLRATRHLLVIDNAESITATPDAIPHALPESERVLLRQWLSRLRAGRTLVLWGSREAETWAAQASFGPNIYELAGLDPQAASTLANRILTRHGATRHQDDPDQREALGELLRTLGGYPLPLEVVLPILATTPPTEVLAQLNTGHTAADPVGLIRSAIEYSHGKLDPTIQTSLLMLAPFTTTIPGGDILEDYQQLLDHHEPTQNGWGPINLTEGLAAAIRIGLAAEHHELAGWADIVPVLPYFLRQRLHDHPEWLAAIQQAHYDLYAEFAPAFQQLMLSSEPGERAAGRALARASYANLTSAVGFAVEQHHPVVPIVNSLEEYLDQTRQQTARWHLLRGVVTALAGRADETTRREMSDLFNLAGLIAGQQRRFEEAEQFFRQALDLFLEFGDRQSVAGIYHNLGNLAEGQRRFEEAERLFRQALDLFLEFGDRRSAATTYHQLGMLAEEQLRFEEAEHFLQQALDLELELNDRHGAMITYHQLGILAQQQRRLEEAEQLYRQALDLSLEFDDRHSAASTYHQLGILAQLQRRLEEAEQLYRQGLDLSMEFDDRHGAAFTYGQLGMVVQEQRRLEEAERLYRQALDLFLEFDDRHSAASTYYNLGNVAQEQGRLEEAERLYLQALTIYRKESDERRASQTMTVLGGMLIAAGRHADALLVVVDAVSSWGRITGRFDPKDVHLLKELRDLVSIEEFEQGLGKLEPDVRRELRELLAEG